VGIETLTAFEHAEIPVSVASSSGALSGSEATRLENLALRLPRFCERGRRSVRLGSFCGVTNIGARPLEILPKVDVQGPPEECRGILLGLLQRSRTSRVFRQLAVAQRLRQAPLLEVFIAAFFDEVSQLVRAGLMREYQTHEDDLRTVRGRVLIDRQFSVLSNRRDIVGCQFDDLTADNAWNRFIKAGLLAVRGWIGHEELNRRWGGLMIAFEEVADVRTRESELSGLRVDRRAVRYLPAAEWVRRILEVLSPSLRFGEASSPGLLFDINKLWEDAVNVELGRRLHAAGVQVEAQVTGRYFARMVETESSVVQLRPDLLFAQRGQVVAIADTKWKRVAVSPTGHLIPHREDVYQMHAYASAFGCERLALIYPWHTGLSESKESTLELPAAGRLRPRLSMVCVDPRDGKFEVLRGAGFLLN
jgi:5-methylcytosine-specific restriction enzyme subunit McrC